ncbi:MAG: sugar ABC transporter substrate-binding protein [Spirochaetaceae bacterium]|jgi:ABC-type sugar transport system substrate-binding protein|nr:sugar ABC transporter substrate-binding protein [Spirochaetaceae bacterium]GMO17342.1 MAG: D-ribose ABC transporter substrate-binding protein [Termitinemataceae bacterium]
MKKVRIGFLKLLPLFIAVAIAAGVTSCKKKSAPDKIYIGVSIASLENEYWASLARGAELFAQSLPENTAEVVIMTAAEPDKQMANIESFITKYGEAGIMFIDPMSGAITPAIAALCEDAKVYYVNYANKDDNLFPTDFQYFVAYETQDDENSGYLAAKDLFNSIGGKGKVAELRGVLGNDAARKRNAGFEKALKEFPEIEVLDAQVANYVSSEAFTITQQWITRFGDSLAAIYCHNDDMAIGAAEALTQKDMNGKIKISGFDGTAAAFNAIKEGRMYSTIFNNGFLVGGYGAALAYSARTGKIDTKTMDQTKRMFYSRVSLVKSENVDDIINNYVKATPSFNFDDIDYAIAGIIPNPKLK